MTRFSHFTAIIVGLFLLPSCQKTASASKIKDAENSETADFCSDPSILSTEPGPMSGSDSANGGEQSGKDDSKQEESLADFSDTFLLGDRILIDRALQVGLDFADASHMGAGGIPKPHISIAAEGGDILKVGVDGRIWNGKLGNVSKSGWKSIFSNRNFLSQFEKFLGKCIRSGISPAGLVNVLRPIIGQLKNIPPSFATNLGKIAGAAGKVAASVSVGAALQVLLCPSPAHASEMRHCEDIRNETAQRMYQVAYAKLAYKVLTCEMYGHVNDASRREYVESLREGRARLNTSFYEGFYREFEENSRSCIREQNEDSKNSYNEALSYLKTIEASIEEIPLTLTDAELDTLCDPKSGEYLGE